MRRTLSAAFTCENARNISVGIKNADIGDGGRWEALLPARFSEQSIRRKDRRRLVILVAKNWRHSFRVVAVWCFHCDCSVSRGGRCSCIATATTTPDASVRMRIEAIAQAAAKRSVMMPASRAPIQALNTNTLSAAVMASAPSSIELRRQPSTRAASTIPRASRTLFLHFW